MNERPLTVLLALSDPDGKRQVTNPYTSLLVRGIREDPRVRVAFFRWKGALSDKFDVLHVHWPEVFVKHPKKRIRVVRSAALLVFLARIRLQKKTIVRTVHNVVPHEALGAIERFALRQLDRATDRWIILNETTPTPDRAATVLVRHGHYRDWYDEPDETASVPGRVLAFGLIRAYKGMDELVGAFRAIQEDDVSLTIAGKPDSAETVSALESLKGDDQRITLDLRFVPDDVLATQIAEASLVVLPYKEVHNSGVALLSLSLNRPILLRDSPSTRLLVEEFGEQWVVLFDGALTAEIIRSAMRAAEASTREARVDMQSRDWSLLAQATVDTYVDAYEQSRSGR